MKARLKDVYIGDCGVKRIEKPLLGYILLPNFVTMFHARPSGKKNVNFVN